jgi:hypothetical protein
MPPSVADCSPDTQPIVKPRPRSAVEKETVRIVVGALDRVTRAGAVGDADATRVPSRVEQVGGDIDVVRGPEGVGVRVLRLAEREGRVPVGEVAVVGARRRVRRVE